ncbi:hypothetical protein RB195_001926 [Necator americanus]|uniref:Reverse transcriptase domain-containing protein n=1 Tax=Necator americanus TaxID=51031 RepID=A0ABR1DGJ2_NECAM
MRCDPTPALTTFVAYAPTSSYEEEEVEAFCMDLEKFYREDHAFYKVIIGDFNAKVEPRRTPEKLHTGTHDLQWNDKGEKLPEFIMMTKTIHKNSQFQKHSSLRWTWESPGGGYRNEIDHIIVNKRGGEKHPLCPSRLRQSQDENHCSPEPKGNSHCIEKGVEKIIYDFYSDLFDSHVHLLPHHLREDGQVIPEVLPSEIRHVLLSVRNRTIPGPDRIKPEQLKNLPPVLINTLARLFTRYLSECKVPKQWKTNKTVFLYKKGDPHDIGNYCPTCLLSVIYKLFTRAILNRTENVLDEGQPCKQDFEKDSVRLTTFILFRNSSRDGSGRRSLGQPRRPYSVHKATLENAMRKLEWDDMGVKVDGRQLHHLRFADDIVLVTPSISQAERMLTEIKYVDASVFS